MTRPTPEEPESIPTPHKHVWVEIGTYRDRNGRSTPMLACRDCAILFEPAKPGRKRKD